MNDDLTIQDLVKFRNTENVYFLDSFAQQSKKWRSRYRDINTALPEQLTWEKNKDLPGGNNANKVELLIYLTPTGSTGVIVYRSGGLETYNTFINQCNRHFSNKSTDSRGLLTYTNDLNVIQFARNEINFFIIVMAVDDYNKGIRIN